MQDARLLVDTLRLTAPANADALADGWGGADSGALVRLAEFEGAQLWLSRRLKAHGITLTGDARDRLAASAKRGIAQSLRVDAATAAVLGTLDAAGIPAVPLKAAAIRRLAARVPYADARAPNDVDLLVPEPAAARAWEALGAAGYVAPTAAGPPDGHHLPGLVGAAGVGVELHVTTVAAVAPSEAWRRATSDGATADFDGRSRPVPGDTELLWHAIAHPLVHADESAHIGIRLRFWLDAAALLAAGATIDWERIRARLGAPETIHPALARAWLRAAAGLSGRPLPPGAIGGPPAAPFNIERLMAWRLRLFAGRAPDGRWAGKLLEEGARGEAGLAPERPQPTAPPIAHLRHAFAARAARAWWMLRR